MPFSVMIWPNKPKTFGCFTGTFFPFFFLLQGIEVSTFTLEYLRNPSFPDLTDATTVFYAKFWSRVYQNWRWLFLKVYYRLHKQRELAGLGGGPAARRRRAVRVRRPGRYGRLAGRRLQSQLYVRFAYETDDRPATTPEPTSPTTTEEPTTWETTTLRYTTTIESPTTMTTGADDMALWNNNALVCRKNWPAGPLAVKRFFAKMEDWAKLLQRRIGIKVNTMNCILCQCHFIILSLCF